MLLPGILRVAVETDGLILMQQNKPEYLEIIEADEMRSSMGPAYIAAETPVQVISTGLKDIMLPVANAASLGELRPDFKTMADFSQKKGVVGVHAFAVPDDRSEDAICRNFAPLYGIDEEIKTVHVGGYSYIVEEVSIEC